MELYSRVSSLLARTLTRQYSSSFSSASRLFPKSTEQHIYNIYGLVRIADEVVDTYRESDRLQILDELEQETYEAIRRGFSTNPIVQAFSDTARAYGIGIDLIKPFFASMRMDVTPKPMNRKTYEKYIYGSAEVVGLMCLKVFTAGNAKQYAELAPGAQLLGAAYQKVNFLRDLAADYRELGRLYFPDTSFESFDDTAKLAITTDIRADFEAALPYVHSLPVSVRRAVRVSYDYYIELLQKLERAAADDIKERRLRVPGYRKAGILARHAVRGRA